MPCRNRSLLPGWCLDETTRKLGRICLTRSLTHSLTHISLPVGGIRLNHQDSLPTKHYQAVVIGGGVVGASILYHLAKNGWKNVGLIERAELTAGSTWHAAAGFHAQNKDSNIAGLQAYTIKLYNEIEKESGQSVGLKKTGGYSLAGTYPLVHLLIHSFIFYSYQVPKKDLIV